MTEKPVPEQAADLCTCGMGNAPVSHHDDHCALQGEAYYHEGETVPGEEEPAPAGAPAEAVVAYEAQVVEPAPADALAQAMDLPVTPPSEEMRALASMAMTLAHADAVPKALRRKPNDVFLVLLSARDTGVKLTTAMREFHVIEGTVTISPKAKLAMIRQSGKGRIWPAADNDAESATWHAIRSDQPDHTVTSTFSWEDAQLAGLVDSRCKPRSHWRPEPGSKAGQAKQTCMCKDNWKRYPQRMLSWRAVGYLEDDVFPEVATGIYSPDELGALTDEHGEPIDVTAVDPLPGTKGGPRQAVEELASDADRAAVTERLARLTDDAKAAVRSWWMEQELEPLASIPARRIGRVLARLDWVEQQPGTLRPEVAATAGAAPEDLEPTAAPETGTERVLVAATGSLVEWAIEAARASAVADLQAEFRAAGMQPPAGGDDVVRRAWCEWRLVEAITATCTWLSLAVLGVNVIDPEDVAEAYAEQSA